jgi:SAM-dependent methyltransferase
MDLRPYLADRPKMLKAGAKFVETAQLFYQPFILADGFEVGEGQNLVENYRGCESALDNNVSLAPQYLPLWKGNSRKLAVDSKYFSQCNHRYRLCYERIADTIAAKVNLSSSTVMELGCNTGLTLFYLAQRGAGRCIGIDSNDYRSQFHWLNATLGTHVTFHRDNYDNIKHQLRRDPGCFDVVVNTVFLNHQSDPLLCLAYLADRARAGIFLWLLLNDSDDMVIQYGKVSGIHDLGAGKRFPGAFRNDVTISRPLLIESLHGLGFDDVEFIEAPLDPDSAPPESLAPFTMLYARRTAPVRSALARLSLFTRAKFAVGRADQRLFKGAIRRMVRLGRFLRHLAK